MHSSLRCIDRRNILRRSLLRRDDAEWYNTALRRKSTSVGKIFRSLWSGATVARGTRRSEKAYELFESARCGRSMESGAGIFSTDRRLHQARKSERSRKQQHDCRGISEIVRY